MKRAICIIVIYDVHVRCMERVTDTQYCYRSAVVVALSVLQYKQDASTKIEYYSLHKCYHDTSKYVDNVVDGRPG